MLRVQGPGARFVGPRPRTVPSLVYIQVRSVYSEREAIELRIQAVLAVLECRYLGKEILNYFTFLKLVDQRKIFAVLLCTELRNGFRDLLCIT